MKKLLALALASLMLLSLTACGGDTQPQGDTDPVEQQEPSGNTGEETGRSKATEFIFELAEEEERVVENLIFDEDVTVSGDFGMIVFENCEFNGDLINTAEQFTRVILSDGTSVNGNCVLRNTTKEASMDYPVPKFIGANILSIVCEDCIGACVLDGTDGTVLFNGESYSLAEAELYYDADADALIPYEGQEASSLFVGQWWENGEKVMQVFCE